MSITMINSTQKAFVVVNKAVAMDKELGLRDRGMMLTLMSFPPEWDFSIRGLETIIPDGRDAISSSLQRLENKNYLVRRQSRNEDGKFADTKIYINPNPKESPWIDYPHTENPSTANPDTAKPLPENPTQINNKEIKNKRINKKESINHSAANFDETVEDVKAQIEYDAIASDRKNDISLLNYIVDLIARTLITDKPVIRIAGSDRPAEQVKAKMENISFFNVEFVIDRMREVDTKITDFDGYLLTCLYKADEQEEIFLDNLIKQQEKGGWK